MMPLPFRRELPPGTRLILASEDLLATWGARSEDGYRISAEWGDEKPEGWYEPTFTKHFNDNLIAEATELLVERAKAEMTRRYGWDPTRDDALDAILDAEAASAN